MGWPTDYAGWKTRLKEWLASYDLPESYFGSCMDSAIETLNRDLSSQWMESTHEFTVVDGSPIDIATEIPNFNRMRLVTVRGGLPLNVKAINEYKNALAENPSGSGDPSIYTVSAMKLYIWPPATVDSIVDID